MDNNQKTRSQKANIGTARHTAQLRPSDSKLPRHVAIVMDGNGRWAKRRKLPRAAGHRAGAQAVRKVVEFCSRKGIDVLTLFALSVENCNHRPMSEVKFLMFLFLDSLKRNTEELHKNNIRIRIIGDRTQFDDKLLQQIQQSEKLTASNNGLTLVIAINYSGRWDIVQAACRLADKVQKQSIPLSDITNTTFQKYLCLEDLPEPELLIRTSGEQRISNFMLWQLAYTEMFFSDVYWPDFDEPVFEEALAFYQSRQRRFGLTTEQIELQDA